MSDIFWDITGMLIGLFSGIYIGLVISAWFIC